MSGVPGGSWGGSTQSLGPHFQAGHKQCERQFDVLQGCPAGLASVIPPIRQLQSSWCTGACSWGSSTSCSCSIIHEDLPGPVSQVPMQREAWLLGIGAGVEERGKLETKA